MSARLSAIEVFAVAFFPSRVEEDLIGADIAAEMEGSEALAGPRAAFLQAFAASLPRRTADLQRIAAILEAHGLAAPAAPARASEVAAWREALGESLARALAPASMERAVMAVAADVAEAWLAVNLGALLAPLLDAAPDHAALRARVVEMAVRRNHAVSRLSASAPTLSHPSAGPVARDIAAVLSSPDVLRGGPGRLRELAALLGKLVDALQLALAAPAATSGPAAAIGEADAFLLTVDPSVIGVPLLARAFVAAAEAASGTPAVAARAKFLLEAYEIMARRAPARWAQLERLLRRLGVAPTPPPGDPAAFGTWRDGVIAATLGRVEGASAAAATFGAVLGVALVASDLLATTSSLLAVAPAAPGLVAQRAAITAQLEKARAQLAAHATHEHASPELRRAAARAQEILATAPAPETLAGDDERATSARMTARALDEARVALERAGSSGLRPEETFRLGFLPTAIGAAFEGLAIAGRVEQGAAPPLAARVAQVAQALRARNAETVADVLHVEGLLDAAALPRPERPRDVGTYRTWLKAVRQASGTVAAPATAGGAALLAGYFVAEVHQLLGLGLATLTLLEAAPEHPLLVEQAAALERMLPAALANLRKAITHPALPAAMAAAGAEVAQAAAEAPRVDDAAQPALARLPAMQRALERAVTAVAPLRSR